MKKTFKIGAEVLAGLILLVLTISIGLWVYVKFFAPDSFTELVVNLGTIEDTNGKKAIIEVACYENKDKSGIELLDVKFNGYSDINAKNIVSFGVQVVGGVNNLASINDAKTHTKTINFLGILPVAIDTAHHYSFLSGKLGKENEKKGKLSFYQESDNLNYANVNTAFDDFGYIRVEIEDKIYALQLGCVRDSYKILWENQHNTSSLSEFIKDIEKQVKSCPIGETAKTFSYKDMFKVLEYKNGKFEDITNQDEVYNYIYIDFKHYTTGAKTAQDSLFKQIQYNTNFIYGNSSPLDVHFSDKELHYLNNNDLHFIYDETKGCHLLDVTEECYKYYKDKELNLIISIDKDYLKINNVIYGGINENGLIKELNITSIYVTENGVKSEVAL